MFRGAFEHTIDDKGRVSVPSRFRDIVLSSNDDRVVVATFKFHTFRCLDVYPFPAWASVEQHIAARPQLTQETRQLQHYYLSGSHDCQLDKQGRILLPTSLRNYANLIRDVMITGCGDKFNIWNRETWSEAAAHAEQELFSNEQAVGAAGI